MIENQEKIIYLYNNGLSCRKIGILLNTHHKKISAILKENNVKITHIKCQINSEFIFSESNEKYYFFGFLLGDGSIYKYKNTYCLDIGLAEKDKIILEKFCNYLNYPNSRIRHKINNGKRTVQLQIKNKLFATDFSNLGLVPNKTYNPSQIILPTHAIIPFMIGYLDADGTIEFDKIRINKNKKQYKISRISLIGHPANINWFTSILNNLNINVKINSYIVNNKWKRITIGNKKDIIKFAKAINIIAYKNLCLNRKWSNLINYISKN